MRCRTEDEKQHAKTGEGTMRTQVLEDTAPTTIKLSTMLITDVTCKLLSVGFAVTCNNKKVPIRNETPGSGRGARL